MLELWRISFLRKWMLYTLKNRITATWADKSASSGFVGVINFRTTRFDKLVCKEKSFCPFQKLPSFFNSKPTRVDKTDNNNANNSNSTSNNIHNMPLHEPISATSPEVYGTWELYDYVKIAIPYKAQVWGNVPVVPSYHLIHRRPNCVFKTPRIRIWTYGTRCYVDVNCRQYRITAYMRDVIHTSEKSGSRFTWRTNNSFTRFNRNWAHYLTKKENEREGAMQDTASQKCRITFIAKSKECLSIHTWSSSVIIKIYVTAF